VFCSATSSIAYCRHSTSSTYVTHESGGNFVGTTVLQVKQHILGHALDDLSEPTPATDTAALTSTAAAAAACPDWLSDASSSSSAASQQQQQASQRRRSSSSNQQQQQRFAPACSDDLEWGASASDDVDRDVSTTATAATATAAASKAGAPLVEGSMRGQGPNWAQESFSRLGQQVLQQLTTYLHKMFDIKLPILVA
jgi:hypothetical protein